MIKKIEIMVFICENCGNVWTPKQKDVLPKVCSNPACHSSHWNDKGEIKDEILSIPKWYIDTIDYIRDHIENCETYNEKKACQDEAVILLKNYMSEDDVRKFVPILKDEILSTQKIPQYVLDQIKGFEKNIENFEREIKELEKTSSPEDVVKIKTKKQSSIAIQKEIDSLKRKYNIHTTTKYDGKVEKTISAAEKANITVVLERIKNNLDDSDYVAELISKLDIELLDDKLTRSDISDIIRNVGLSNILLTENIGRNVEKNFGSDIKGNIEVILYLIKNNLSDSNFVTELIFTLDHQLSHNKLTKNDIVYMIKNVGLENILLAENKYANVDITLYKETQKRLDDYKEQIPKLEARRDELLLIEKRTDNEIDELRDTKNKLEKLSRLEIGDTEQLNKLKERCPNMEEFDKL